MANGVLRAEVPAPTPSAPPAPISPLSPCEVCGTHATLTCGACVDLFLCDKEGCFVATHPRARDQGVHRARLVGYGVAAKCEIHTEQDLCLVCTEPSCGGLMCLRCERHGVHRGHCCVDLLDAYHAERAAACMAAGDVRAVCDGIAGSFVQMRESLFTSSATKHVKRALVACLLAQECAGRAAVRVEEEALRAGLQHSRQLRAEEQQGREYVAAAAAVLCCDEALQRLPDDQPLRIITDAVALQTRIAALPQPPTTPAEPSLVYTEPAHCVCFQKMHITALPPCNLTWYEGGYYDPEFDEYVPQGAYIDQNGNEGWVNVTNQGKDVTYHPVEGPLSITTDTPLQQGRIRLRAEPHEGSGHRFVIGVADRRVHETWCDLEQVGLVLSSTSLFVGNTFDLELAGSQLIHTDGDNVVHINVSHPAYLACSFVGATVSIL